MRRAILLLLTLTLLTACSTQIEDEGTVNTLNPNVIIETTEGNIELELDREAAPQTVANFLSYVEDNYYTNTLFHRTMPGFMIQGGGFTIADDANDPEKKHYVRKETRPPIALEASRKNLRGTIAMARTSNPNSATSQFFINVADNEFLNPGVDGPGYTVFGKVVKGMNVVDDISNKATTVKKAIVAPGQTANMTDWPVDDIKILRVYIK